MARSKYQLGHALFDNSKLGVYMRQNKMESYFDYKAYGRDASISSYDIGDYGYVYKKDSINLSRVPRPYFNMGVGECVLTDTLSFPLIPNILFYCVQTVFTNR